LRANDETRYTGTVMVNLWKPLLTDVLERSR
jgi:hypothetical protein